MGGPPLGTFKIQTITGTEHEISHIYKRNYPFIRFKFPFSNTLLYKNRLPEQKFHELLLLFWPLEGLGKGLLIKQIAFSPSNLKNKCHLLSDNFSDSRRSSCPSADLAPLATPITSLFESCITMCYYFLCILLILLLNCSCLKSTSRPCPLAG